jgi:hypothetical protein
VIFIEYEESCVGWLVRDLNGKVQFSRDVIFNEDLFGCFSIPQSPPSHDNNNKILPRPIHDRICTYAGRDYDEAIRLREL